MAEVFYAFLRLGCISFGGPIAHLAYFRTEFVDRRRWVSDEEFAETVAFCQFLPGPTSSQVGMAIGLRRAGKPGALAAWAGFTAPSAALMLGFAWAFACLGVIGEPGWLKGLKIAAVAVVAQAIRSMSPRLCPDLGRIGLAVFAFLAVTLVPGPWGQMAVIAIGAFVGVWLVSEPSGTSLAPRTDGSLSSVGWMALFVGLLFAVFRLEAISQPLAVFSSFFRSGALVFGGGHVVLPLLHQAVVRPGWIRDDAFLAGYGFAQALPGPLFSFSAFLGSLIPPGGVTGGLLALAAIYLPSFLLLFGLLPQWHRLRANPTAGRAIAGANAVVVGLLAAAFWSPVCTSAILNACDLALALAGWAALSVLKAPPWAVVFGLAAIGWIAL